MTETVKTGGTLKLDPFQTVVAFDMPSGEEFLEIRSIKVVGTDARRWTLTLKGDQRSSFTLSDDAQAYNGGTLLATLGLTDFLGDTGIYSTATSFPPLDTPCFSAGAISTPGGYTIFTFGDGSTVTSPDTITKLDVRNGANVVRNTYIVGTMCGINGGGSERYHKE